MHGGAASWYMDNIPESLRQRTGTAFWEDIAFYISPWGFNISDMPNDLAQATHIWQAWSRTSLHCCLSTISRVSVIHLNQP